MLRRCLLAVVESCFSVVTEVAVVGLTWAKTASVRRTALRENLRMPLITLLQRDGQSIDAVLIHRVLTSNPLQDRYT